MLLNLPQCPQLPESPLPSQCPLTSRVPLSPLRTFILHNTPQPSKVPPPQSTEVPLLCYRATSPTIVPPAFNNVPQCPTQSLKYTSVFYSSPGKPQPPGETSRPLQRAHPPTVALSSLQKSHPLPTGPPRLLQSPPTPFRTPIPHSDT